MDIDKLIVGKSKSVLELKLLINKVASSESTVLILGETGTGKELVAEAIHKISNRKGQFIPVNCLLKIYQLVAHNTLAPYPDPHSSELHQIDL